MIILFSILCAIILVACLLLCDLIVQLTTVELSKLTAENQSRPIS